MAILDNFKVALGYDYDPKDLEKFNSIVAKSGALVKRLSLVSVGLATSLGLTIIALSRQAVAQARFGRNMGLSQQSVEAFARVSNKLTGDRGTAGGLIQMFDGISNAWKAGETPSVNFLRAMAKLGIGLNEFQDIAADERLLLISERFQELDDDGQDIEK